MKSRIKPFISGRAGKGHHGKDEMGFSGMRLKYAFGALAFLTVLLTVVGNVSPLKAQGFSSDPQGTGTALSPALQALLPRLIEAVRNNPQLASQLSGLVSGNVAGSVGALGGFQAPAVAAPADPATAAAQQAPAAQQRNLFSGSPELTLIDGNNDGAINADEAAAYLEWMFRRRDINGNGTLSPREFAAVEKTGPNDTNKARMRSESRRIAQYWAGTDTNGDGRVTKAEFMALAERRFKEMDANGDAKVSPFEYRAAKLF